ncbi:hypothetical protein N7535_002123, partial [Penicillium sp. DV-2018c]
RYLLLKGQPIPSNFLYYPAKIALEALLGLRAVSAPFKERNLTHDLSQDARLLLDSCKALGCYGEALCAAVETALRRISYDTLLKLALMTWHFDASSPVASQDLKFFLRRPYSSVIEILRVRYQTIMRETAPLD